MLSLNEIQVKEQTFVVFFVVVVVFFFCFFFLFFFFFVCLLLFFCLKPSSRYLNQEKRIETKHSSVFVCCL